MGITLLSFGILYSLSGHKDIQIQSASENPQKREYFCSHIMGRVKEKYISMLLWNLSDCSETLHAITQGKQMWTATSPDMKTYVSHWTTVTRIVLWNGLFVKSLWCANTPSSVLSRNSFSQNWKEGGNMAFTAGRITPDLPNPDVSGTGKEYPLEKFIRE